MGPFLRLAQRSLPGSWARAGPGLCSTKRTTRRLATGPEGSIVYTHSDCVCNEMLALLNRHQVGGLPTPSCEVVRRLKAVLGSYPVPELVRMTRREVIECYTGSKRKELERAAESLAKEPVCERDSWVKMFLKDDKYVWGIEGKQSASGHSTLSNDMKAPRCIQYRSKRYMLELARYLRPIEHWVYGLRDEYGTRIVAKSRNSHQRAADLWEKSSHFSQPAYILLDHSKFDAHVSLPLLGVEHWFYRRFFPDRGFARLLAWQNTNRGITKNGTRYYTPGTRMSGDLNTGLGNCVCNYAMLQDWLNQAGVQGSIYVDGDDSVVIVDASVLSLLLGCSGGIRAHFLQYGMETKFDVVHVWEKVDFCQTRPVWDGTAWRMVRDPERLLTRTMWTTRKYGPKFTKRLLMSLGLCELACNQGLPIGQALATGLIAAGEGKLWKLVDNYHRAKDEAWAPGRARVRAVLPETRESYARAWDIPIARQLEIESALQLSVSAHTADDWSLYWQIFA